MIPYNFPSTLVPMGDIGWWRSVWPAGESRLSDGMWTNQEAAACGTHKQIWRDRRDLGEIELQESVKVWEERE